MDAYTPHSFKFLQSNTYMILLTFCDSLLIHDIAKYFKQLPRKFCDKIFRDDHLIQIWSYAYGTYIPTYVCIKFFKNFCNGQPTLVANKN